MRPMVCTCERGSQGQWCVSGFDRAGCYLARQFFYYSRREAVALWRADARGVTS